MIPIIMLSIGMPAVSQNRIASWDAGKITEIRIETRYAIDSASSLTLTSGQAITKVMDFLRNVDFREHHVLVETAEKKKPEVWKYKLVFTGQRDEVYLFSTFAFIGKTRYTIDASVVSDFRRVLDRL